MTAPAGWVQRRLGARLIDAPDGDARPAGVDGVAELVRLALRRNPKRAHLLVSTVLGKHLPADPRRIREHGLRLGAAVRERVGPGPVVALGFAETATGLGHLVAESLQARYLHSTRREVAGAVTRVGFEEEHSHAVGHRLLPEDPDLLTGSEPLVLVDDELSTGTTALNTIRQLHHPGRTRYVLAALADLRPPADRARLADVAAELGVSIDVVALGAGLFEAPASFPSDAAALVAAQAPPAASRAHATAAVTRHPPRWPIGTRDGGRHGFGPADVRAAYAAAAAVAADLARELPARTLVLGTEELMYAPTLIGCALADLGCDIRVSSTTRSPVWVRDEPGYPIRTAVRFTAGTEEEGGPGPRFAYNVTGFDSVVLVTDAEPPPDLLEGLRRETGHVHVVLLPSYRPLPPALRGPAFGSYRPDEVAWLLTDLSDVALEAPTEEREEAVQSGGAHYAESLPVEYQPDAQYLALFDEALATSAARIAHAVGVVCEIVLAERRSPPVLASLARAGTPVGVLMRRWMAFTRGIDVPHYAVSIVRGRGIDTQALRYLATRHDPAEVVFVDGWTGKGAIAGELAAAVQQVNETWGTRFDPAMAVLADPGSCVTTFGTREDFLVPSACLNSTVSGLVSRTVLNTALLAPGQFHGAKFYAELARADVSHRFLDAISDRFAQVLDAVRADWPVVQAGDRTPTWAGWADVERLAAEHGVGEVTLVKPGVGETTRVLLRRVPWKVLIRPGADAELAHVRLLAERRGVPVEEVDGLTYRCVGLIHPRFTRGATGPDGRRVASA